MKEVLESLVIDTVSDHNTQETAKRVAKMFVKRFLLADTKVCPRLPISPNISQLNELMVIGPGGYFEEVHAPTIYVRLWVSYGLAYYPHSDSKLIGLSKYARVADWITSRPQIQEEAVIQLADLLESRIKTHWLSCCDGRRPLSVCNGVASKTMIQKCLIA
jgi:GTP cyclohydrolase I